jgi:hypothetical protein
LRRRAERAEAGLKRAHKEIEVHGNVSALLGDLQAPEGRHAEHRAMIEQTVEDPRPESRPGRRAGRSESRRPRSIAVGDAVTTATAIPGRALTHDERDAVLAELHSECFADRSPAQVSATLPDEVYLCSRRTMYRLLVGEHGHVRDGATSSRILPTTARK